MLVKGDNMYRNTIQFRRSLIILLDILLSIFAYFTAYHIRDRLFIKEYGPLQPLDKYIWVLWIIIPLLVILFNIFKLYDVKKSITKLVLQIWLSIALGIICIAAIFYFIGDTTFSRLFYGIFSIIEFIIIFTVRIVLKLIYNIRMKNEKFHKRLLIVGTGYTAQGVADYINEHPELMIKLIGYVQVDEDIKIKDGQVLGHIDNLIEIIKENCIDEVIFALPKNYIGEVEKYVLACEEMGITVSVVAHLYDLKISKTQIGKIGQIPVLTYHSVSLNEWELFLKRLIDIVGACIGLVITGIALIIIGPLIWLEDRGPIFFAQDRVGQNGRIFKCYKFRSMYVDAEERKKELMKYNEMKGHMFKMKNDPRITKIGKFIRATSIDELPQFWNVLKGDMSLIGTRPPTVDEVKNYENYHRRRISIKPGITGMWQVSGRSSIEDFEEIVKLDTQYIDNWSIWLDIKILFKTLVIVFSRQGSY